MVKIFLGLLLRSVPEHDKCAAAVDLAVLFNAMCLFFWLHYTQLLFSIYEELSCSSLFQHFCSTMMKALEEQCLLE